MINVNDPASRTLAIQSFEAARASPDMTPPFRGVRPSTRAGAVYRDGRQLTGNSHTSWFCQSRPAGVYDPRRPRRTRCCAVVGQRSGPTRLVIISDGSILSSARNIER